MKNKKRTQWPLLLLTTAVIALFINACTFGTGQVIKGDGNVVTTLHETGYYNSIDIQGVFNVQLVSGAGLPVELQTDENLQELILLEVRNNTLYVSTTKQAIFNPTKMELIIPYSELEKISIGGACKLSSETAVVSNNLLLEVSGAGDIDLMVDLESLRTRISGAANISLEGSAEKHSANLSGASNMRAEKLLTKNTQVSLSGAGSAHIYASESLDASLSGVGSIRYYGDPVKKSISKSGIGSIRASE